MRFLNTTQSAHRFGRLLAGAALLGLTVGASAQVEVKTVAGGRTAGSGPDFGFVDGDTIARSQFHTPFGAAVDENGVVYVADRDNGAIRRIDTAKARVSTIISGLNQPVGVVVHGLNDIYFVTKGDGRVTRVDRFGTITPIASGLTSPTALALDSNTNIVVTEERGVVLRITPSTGTRVTVATGLNRPGGIAVLDTGLLAISETGAHMVRFINPVDGRTVLKIGSGEAGFRDGTPNLARFNQPHHLARTPGGGLVVADRLNHRVRLIDVRGEVSTLFGIDASAWEGPECLTCDPIILPGWFDGPVEFAEIREPVGVAVSREGKLYASEVFYHIIREVGGASLTGGGTGGTGGAGGTNGLVVLPPVISPESGFYPMGQVITVTNPNTNSFLANAIYYTTDGTEPTTNSFKLEMSGGQGALVWHDPKRDLTSLRLKAFLGSQASETVSGVPVKVSEIGVSRDVVAGMGSTLVLPIVVNLRTNLPLKSLQFRVEVTPASASAPMIPETFTALSISTNDFIIPITSDRTAQNSEDKSLFTVASYTLERSRGLVVTMLGTNANFSVKDFSVVAQLALPVPTDAKEGDRYQIEIVRPSGTSDGFQETVPLSPMPPRFVTVKRLGYEVGDTAPGIWYNADSPGLGFGNGTLDNADVNNVFAASLGVRLPTSFSDLFDAMDAFPIDSEAGAGGDGLIRFLDWQVILMRALGLDPSRWVRTWSEGGARVASNVNVGSAARASRSTPAQTVSGKPPGLVWHREALIKGTSVENVRPGVPVDIPVFVVVSPDARLGGLAFRASVKPEGAAPPVTDPIQFLRGPTLPDPLQSVGLVPSELLCGWSLVPSPSFKPALTGTNLLGYLRVTVPNSAPAGGSYAVHFENADGAPDLETQYDFETLKTTLWVLTPAQRSAETITDEWKTRFFGSPFAPEAREDGDPDGDRISNLREFEAGTDPTDKASGLWLHAPVWDSKRNGVVLRWLSAPGKKYALEGSTDLIGGSWSVLAENLPGDGFIQEWPVLGGAQNARFYRLRLQR